jgi:LuxR family transcriptional regulator, maltose regulon positive regulatory protein
MPDASARNRGRADREGPPSIAPAGGWLGTPSVGTFHVRRPRLVQRLKSAHECQLILVSAPAGYGKTSLVADWIGSLGADERTAWVTFEEHDEGFWHGLVGCLESMGVEASADTFSHTGPRVDPRLLTSLASLIAAQGSRLRVVVDGHDIISEAVGRDLDFLLRHSGHRLQLVLLTRSDPLMPLYRYRLDDTIAELRMRDLAFTDAEASELFASNGVELGESSIEALNARAEGWAVGLRFASAMLRERADTDAAVAEVVGDSGNIAEYLVAEVLEVQTPEIRQLLLSTSITDMVRPGLDAALGGASAARDLSLLTRENAFVEPVPGHPGCYRYHPFFRDLLRATLTYEDPQELERLHRVAAEWFADHGEVEESVRQLTAIHAWDEAARRVVANHGLGELLLHGSSGTLRNRLRTMPRVTRGPAAPLVRAALSLLQGETAQSARDLVRARQAIDSSPGKPDDDAEVALAVLDALRARNDDPRTAAELADRAATALTSTLGAHPDPDPLLVGLVGASRGIAAIRAGDLTLAAENFTEVASAASPPEPLLTAESEGFLALLSCFQGRLSHAGELAGRALAAAEQIGLPAVGRPSAASLALAWVAVERCDLPAAVGHAAQAGKSRFLAGDPVSLAVLALIRSRTEAARGHLPHASSIVQAAIAEATADEWSTEVLHLEAARLALANGRLGLVGEHLAGPYGREEPETVLLEAQLALARGDDLDLDTASAVLESSTALHLQVSGLLTLAADRLRDGSPGRARVAVDRALRLAAGENLRRPFHEATPEVRQLLLNDAGLLAHHPWLGADGRSPAVDRNRSDPLKPSTEEPAPVLEELTPRELEVLGHLAELLSTEEIANAMFVSVNTVRTHVRSILRKLGVPRRNAAVRRARELDLIGS